MLAGGSPKRESKKAASTQRVVVLPVSIKGGLESCQFLSLLRPPYVASVVSDEMKQKEKEEKEELDEQDIETAIFLFNDNKIYELTVWQGDMNSWAVGDSIVSDGNIWVATPYDPLFLFLPLLQISKGTGLCKLEDIIYEHLERQPDLSKLVKCYQEEERSSTTSNILNGRLKEICDIIVQDEEMYFRLSEEKVGIWLKGKVDRILAKLDEFEGVKEHLIHASQEDRLKISIRIVAENLNPSQKEILKTSYGMKDLEEAKLAIFQDEIKHRGRGGDDEGKKDTKKVKVAPKKEVKTHNTTGMKKMSSFFAKKA